VIAHHIVELLRGALVHYGYWAIVAVLLLENAGLPLPGETVLLLASFLAYSERSLQLGWIMVLGTVAATVGDNLGYAIGRRGGRPLLRRHQHIFRIGEATLARGEDLFKRYGAATIFFARFIFGMRIFAGPMAGVLRMPWKKFAVFNLLGAALWVTAISGAGYLFGRHWERLERGLQRVDLIAVIVIALAIAVWWVRKRRGK
jgi:membrane-associated protein